MEIMIEIEEQDMGIRAAIELNGSAVKDGSISLLITKVGSWFQVNVNRNQSTMGYNSVPAGPLIVDIPVEGVEKEKAINTEQAAKLFASQLECLFPMAEVFVKRAKVDFQERKDSF